MKFTPALTLILAMVAAPFASAAVHVTSDQSAKISQELVNSLGVDVISIEQSPVAELYQVMTDRGILYVTKDGTKLIHGNMYALNKGMKNLTEAAMATPRLAIVDSLKDHMLVYKAKHQKFVVTVFTDTTCGYCRKLHSEMQEYNDLGITIQYLAFPRQGVPSANADEMRSIWCAKDPLQAMTDAKAGQSIQKQTCNAEIKKQYEAGQAIGITGTPAMILADGTLIPGYQPPASLLKILESSQK